MILSHCKLDLSSFINLLIFPSSMWEWKKWVLNIYLDWSHLLLISWTKGWSGRGSTHEHWLAIADASRESLRVCLSQQWLSLSVPNPWEGQEAHLQKFGRPHPSFKAIHCLYMQRRHVYCIQYQSSFDYAMLFIAFFFFFGKISLNIF